MTKRRRPDGSTAQRPVETITQRMIQALRHYQPKFGWYWVAEKIEKPPPVKTEEADGWVCVTTFLPMQYVRKWGRLTQDRKRVSRINEFNRAVDEVFIRPFHGSEV